MNRGRRLGDSHQTGTKDAQRSGRGQLPGSIQQRIDEIMVPKRHWRAILRAGLSAIPNRRKTTRARFNRRQTMLICQENSVLMHYN